MTKRIDNRLNVLACCAMVAGMAAAGEPCAAVLFIIIGAGMALAHGKIKR